MYMYMKTHIWWGQTSYILDSSVSSLLAVISREYTQLVQRTTGLYTEGSGSVVSELIHHVIT